MKNRWHKHVVIYSATLLIIGFSFFAFNLYRMFYQPMLSPEQPAIVVNLDKFTCASSFVHTLQTENLIKSERLFTLLIRLQGLSSQLKAGIYQVNPGESAQQFLYRVINGDVIKKTFRIIEGTTKSQVENNLKQAEYLNYNATDWLSISTTFPSAEGLLLADTYHYNAGSQSKDLLQQANLSLMTFLNSSWKQRLPGLPYKSSYELLIAASIIEKEAFVPSERALIAGVIINRLRNHMPLQMDPTVIYALGTRYQGKLAREDMRIDSPYNTYRYRGLPPTPIAMVGKESITAAARPQLTNFLYFVAKGDGSHHFSETYEQQKQAINRYLKKDR